MSTTADEHRRWTRAEQRVHIAHIQREHARVTDVATLAQERAELRMDVCAALVVRERIIVARRALAQYRRQIL